MRKATTITAVSKWGAHTLAGGTDGAVIGARFGIDAVPQCWRDRIAELREGRGRTPLEEYADMLEAARG